MMPRMLEQQDLGLSNFAIVPTPLLHCGKETDIKCRDRAELKAGWGKTP